MASPVLVSAWSSKEIEVYTNPHSEYTLVKAEESEMNHGYKMITVTLREEV